MANWHKLMHRSDLGPGQVKEITWRDHDLLVYRTEDGVCHALSAYCAHTGAYMPNGVAPDQPLSCILRGDEISCPFHGWRYDGSGRCTAIPPSQRTPPAVSQGRPIIGSWPLRESGEWIQIREWVSEGAEGGSEQP